MKLIKIWERYFLLETIKTALLFLFCFYGVYALIDYANHTAGFNHHNIKIHWQEILIYYVYDFIKRLDILLPLALLIATIRTLCNLNMHHEITALRSSGVSLHRLLRPFLFIALSGSLLILLNLEFLLPSTMTKLRYIEDGRSSKKQSKLNITGARHSTLEDGSILIYQTFDSNLNRFFDVFWVLNIDEIYRMKYLYPSETIPRGEIVDHLIRNEKNTLISFKSMKESPFPKMKFSKEKLFETVTPAEDLSLSVLWSKLPKNHQMQQNEKEYPIVAAFYHKLTVSCFCLLAVIGPAPFCVAATRHLPIFFIYASSIFAFIGLYLSLNAATLLAKRQVIESFWIVGVTILITLPLLWNFFKLRRIQK